MNRRVHLLELTGPGGRIGPAGHGKLELGNQLPAHHVIVHQPEAVLHRLERRGELTHPLAGIKRRKELDRIAQLLDVDPQPMELLFLKIAQPRCALLDLSPRVIEPPGPELAYRIGSRAALPVIGGGPLDQIDQHVAHPLRIQRVDHLIVAFRSGGFQFAPIAPSKLVAMLGQIDVEIARLSERLEKIAQFRSERFQRPLPDRRPE